jgi:hypothetical protein
MLIGDVLRRIVNTDGKAYLLLHTGYDRSSPL